MLREEFDKIHKKTDEEFQACLREFESRMDKIKKRQDEVLRIIRINYQRCAVLLAEFSGDIDDLRKFRSIQTVKQGSDKKPQILNN